MSITATSITPENTLEEFRIQFNNLVVDVDGVAAGNTFTQSIVFEGETADESETTLLATDPTADRTITLPDATGTVVTTGNSDAGATTTNSGEVSHVLVDVSGTLKKITASNLGITGATAADDIGAGDAAVNFTTTSGNITIDAQASDADIIFKGTDDASDITALTLDMSDAGKAIFNGAISATTITLSADAGVIVPDDGNIGSASSTAAIQIASDGVVTFVDDIKLKNDGTIGSAGEAAAMTISSAGIVTFADDIKIKDGGTIGNASVGDVMTLASTGIVTFKDDIVLKDAATIGVASSTSAISIASTGIVTFVDDILIKDGGTIGSASSTSAITIASTGIVTLVDDLVIKDTGTIGSSTTPAAVSIAGDGTVNLATAGATVNSAVIKTAGTETIYVPASAMYPNTTNGCAALAQVELTAGRPELKVLDFDKDSDEFAQFTVAFPKSWNGGTVTFRAFWVGIAATTGIAWGLQAISVGDNAEADAAFGTAVVVTDDSQGDATEVLVTSTSGAITISGAGDDKMTFFQIFRDVSDANDDMAGDARLVGIQLFFTTNATNDA